MHNAAIYQSVVYCKHVHLLAKATCDPLSETRHFLQILNLGFYSDRSFSRLLHRVRGGLHCIILNN